MPVSIKGSGGGSVTLTAGAAAADTTLTIPNVTGTVLQSGTAVTVAQGGTGAATLAANNVLLGNGTSALQVVAPGTSGNVLTSNGTTWVSSASSSGGSPSAIGQIPFSTDGSTYTATQKIVQGTAVASTSGTSIDFTSIPSWVKRVTVMFNGVSTNGAAVSGMLIRIGNGSIISTGYVSGSNLYTSANLTNGATSTTGYILTYAQSNAATNSGSAVLYNITGNTWVISGNIYDTAQLYASTFGGNCALSGALDRVRITTVGGTDTFDAGSINIMYE
jgi:hypothetical protein